MCENSRMNSSRAYQGSRLRSGHTPDPDGLENPCPTEIRWARAQERVSLIREFPSVRASATNWKAAARERVSFLWAAGHTGG